MNVDRFSYMQVQVSATNGIQTHILVQIGSTNCIQKPFVDTKYNQNYVDTFTYQQLGTTRCKLYNVDYPTPFLIEEKTVFTKWFIERNWHKYRK